jgi:thioredoxin-like negative regulator of GroEL
VARRGARALAEPAPDGASSLWRAAVARARLPPEGGGEIASPPPGPWEPDEVWLLDDDGGDSDDGPVTGPAPSGRPTAGERPGGRAAPRHTVPGQVVRELTESVGDQRGAKLAERLAEASHAYDRERYQDALRVLRPLGDMAPASPAVRELHGLTLYRLGRWRQAAKELEAYQALTGAYDQHPVLADCMRGLGRYRKVEALWDELRQASPSAEAVAEGRIVMAGALADRGDVTAAIRLLERSRSLAKKPRDYHLRQWYALADLYERAGDIPQARELFRRLASHDPEAFDTAERLRALR